MFFGYFLSAAVGFAVAGPVLHALDDLFRIVLYAVLILVVALIAARISLRCWLGRRAGRWWQRWCGDGHLAARCGVRPSTLGR
jgi:hypothetical protein